MIEKIPRTFREKHHTETENDSRNHLKAPRDPEGSDTFDVRTSELNEILNQDTPGDRPVLCEKSCAQNQASCLPLLKGNHPSSNMRRCDLRLINRNDSTCHPDGDTRYDTTHYQHASVLDNS